MAASLHSTTRVSACASRRQPSITCHSDARPPLPAALPRRAALGAVAAAVLAPLLPSVRPAAAGEAAQASNSASFATQIEILDNQVGGGTATARKGDLVLIHYTGTTADGTVFDSTLGGQKFRDGGMGVLKPTVVALGGSPVPGICAGLAQGIEGMAVGGKRTFTVPASLGFGGQTVLAPYGIVPAGSTLRYSVELIRLSRQGPEALLKGTSQCGAGGVMERTTGCAAVTPAEYL